MSVVWTITGEAGKALDATPRSLEAMRLGSLSVRFASGNVDRLRWSAPMIGMTPDAATTPERRQKVSLHRDASRYFVGHCIRRYPVFNGTSWSIAIEVAGVWWWMEQITLTSTQTDQAGNDAERPALVFGTGSLSSSFNALFTRGIAKGVPMTIGTIATMYSVPRLTVTGRSFSSTAIDLQMWVPDAMFSVDHSGTGNPALNITRRLSGLAIGSAATRTIDLTSDDYKVTGIDLQPMIELEVKSVRLASASRDGQGRGIWQSALSGTVTPGQDQIVIVSGPETMDTNLPPDTFDSVTVRSKPIRPGGMVTTEILELYDERLRASGATGLGIGTFTVNVSGGGTFTLPGIPTTVERKDGSALPTAFSRFLSQGEPKDWWSRDGIEWEEARVKATLYTTVQSPVPVPNGYSPNPPDFVETLGMQHANYLQSVTGGQRRTDVYYTTVAVLFPAVKTAWNTPTTIYRVEDYSFANPPAGLDGNLLAAQNFVPYSGDVTLVHASGDVPSGNPVGSCIEIANGPTELSGIRAMVQAAEFDIMSGTETLICGASPRMSYEDLVARFRRTGNDTFTYISNKGLRPN